MLVKIRNQYSQEAEVEVEGFNIFNYANKEFEVTLPYNSGVDKTTVDKLERVGFKPSSWSKAVWVINPDSVSHFSSK
jgi:hypothetical protein